MKKLNYFLIILIPVLLFSCKKDDVNNNEGKTIDNETINKWIYQEMSIYYLWNEHIPNQPNYSLYPEQFFYSILYKRDQRDGDRFSWIQDNYLELLNSLSGVTQSDVGFEYVGYAPLDSDNVLGQIAYIKPDTNAEEIGLKRGDYFTHVNGIRLNRSNFRTLLSGDETSVSITFYDRNTGESTNKTVIKHANYAENPVFYDNIYENNGHKIGYLVYNAFVNGPDQKSNIYDKQLNEVFENFKNSQITELVLDLRYNSGGSMSAALMLGSMLAPNHNVNNIFVKLQYNKLVQSELIKQFGEEELFYYMSDKLQTGETINNIGSYINSIYILTGQWTASASELVINSLKPYMNDKPIILIGNITVGKNVGSISIYDNKNSQNKWGMQPIVCYFFNSEDKADFGNGFVPDKEEKDNGDKLQLGDTNEIMLKIAIDHIIDGNFSKTTTQLPDNQLVTIGSSMEQKAWANKTIIDHSYLKKLNFKP
ncbi:MAG: S41 family peptidase [Marinilabiliaceae bacterium]|nr:S41 family peptidase [Marinilabiliaceae bacterium]